MPKVHAKERLYLDSTRTKVLKEGDKDCAFLLAAKGGVIPARYVNLIGALKDKPKPEQEPATAEPVENIQTQEPKKLYRRRR